jgi:hypothetical protein
MVKLLESEFDVLEKKKGAIIPKMNGIKEQYLPNLARRIQELVGGEQKEGEYEAIVRSLKNVKTDIENVQQNIRELQASFKLPMKILSSNKDYLPLFEKYEKISKTNAELGKEAMSLFSVLSGNDGLIAQLNKQWELVKPPSSMDTRSEATSVGKEQESARFARFPDPFDSLCSSESVEDDYAIVLYAAVKEIGNPDAVGNHYSMTWNDIVHAGFRGSKDFKERGIATLEQLQQYIQQRKNPTVPAVSSGKQV